MSNIFDFAGQSSKKPKLPKETKNSSISPENKEKVPIEDAGDMLVRMQNLREEIMHKLDVVYEETGIQPKNLMVFVEEVKAPSKEEYKIAKEKLDQRVANALNLTFQRKKTVKKAKEEGKRRGKTLGDRKKWIPIR